MYAIPKRAWVFFTIFMALLLMAAMAATNMAPLVTAESKDVEAKADYDETSGTLTDTSSGPAPPSGSGVCILHDNGASGTVELDRFATIDIDLYYYATAINYELVVTLIDSSDSTNTVEIKLWISDSSAKTLNADVDDGWGTSEDGSETKTTARSSAWLKVSIKVIETSKSTDGTKKQITVEFDSSDLVEDFVLDAGDLTDVKERTWTEVECKAQDSTDDIYLDEINFDTGGASACGYTIIFWIAIGLIAYSCVAYYFGIIPFQKGGYLKKNINKVFGR